MGTPQTIQIASLGMADSLILMVMALVVFGPRRLPQIGRQIGKLMYEFRKASNDFKFQMEEELRLAEDADRRKKEEERLKTLAANATAPKLSAPEAVASLVPASTADSTVPAASAENPYPNEEVYPPAVAAPAEPPAEETYPRIMPPSTGEQVAASRPNGAAKAANDASAEAQGGAESVASESDADPVAAGENAASFAEAPVKQSSTEAGQAAHHG